eukprot:c4984_g1_i4.p1 GENE.c4984_g1_i4~~c4984_g1_i4.p1  ORF type:complete len:115 (+),score=14.33 c4984_g1_i4:257-601(+)
MLFLIQNERQLHLKSCVLLIGIFDSNIWQGSIGLPMTLFGEERMPFARKYVEPNTILTLASVLIDLSSLRRMVCFVVIAQTTVYCHFETQKSHGNSLHELWGQVPTLGSSFVFL